MSLLEVVAFGTLCVSKATGYIDFVSNFLTCVVDADAGSAHAKTTFCVMEENRQSGLVTRLYTKSREFYVQIVQKTYVEIYVIFIVPTEFLPKEPNVGKG